MKVTKGEGGRETQILTEMIVSKLVLAKIAPHWPAKEQAGLFKSKWANIVAGWCVAYYLKYHKAPRKAMTSLFATWSEGGDEDSVKPDSSTVELVEKFLQGLSRRNENKSKVEPSYIIDLANTHFSEVQLEKHADEIKSDIAKGRLNKAMRKAHGFSGISIATNATFSVLDNKSVLKEALSKEAAAKPLITFDGPAAQFFGNCFVPDSFIAFMGKTGVGKSFFLQRIVKEMIVCGHETLYISVGDMSKLQILRRLCSLILKRPVKAQKFYYPIAIKKYPEDEYASVERESMNYKKDLSVKDGLKLLQKYVKDDLSGNGNLLRMSVHPSGTINPVSVLHIVEEQIRKGFSPKAIVLDYADVMGPMPGHTIADDRSNINAAWAFMRSISQRLPACFLTATQADADSYEAKIITRSNFSDSRKKNDHVTDMLGINQTDEEKEKGQSRLNRIKARDEDYNEKVCLHVAQCLAVSDPLILSTY